MVKIDNRLRLLLPSLLFFGSCITDPPSIPFNVKNVQGTYKIVQWYAVDSITHNIYQLYDSLPLCEKAILIDLDAAGTYSHTHNDSSCTTLPPFAENGQWSLNSNTGYHLIVDTSHLDVSSFNGKTISFWYHSTYNGSAADFSETIVKN